MKRDVIEENHCMIKSSLFDVLNFFSVLARPLLAIAFYALAVWVGEYKCPKFNSLGGENVKI